MYLLTKTTRALGPIQQLFNKRENAIAEAIKFVGYHNEVDGGSSQPQTSDRNGLWSSRRSSSFGERAATVAEITNPNDE